MEESKRDAAIDLADNKSASHDQTTVNLKPAAHMRNLKESELMLISNPKVEESEPLQLGKSKKPNNATKKANPKLPQTDTILKNEPREELQKSSNSPSDSKPSTKKLYFGAATVALVLSCIFFSLYLPSILYTRSASKSTLFLQRIGKSSRSIRMTWLAFQENLMRRREDRATVLELYREASNDAYSSNTELSTLIMDLPKELEEYGAVFNEILFTDACKHLRSATASVGRSQLTRLRHRDYPQVRLGADLHTDLDRHPNEVIATRGLVHRNTLELLFERLPFFR